MAKIEILNEVKDVYDLTVPNGHNYISNGLVSHNTVMFTALACELRVKTLILASQHDWLEQFYETICGSKELDALTNIPDIEKFKGTKIVGICKSVEDYFKYEICLSTYQTFISAKGQKRFNKIKNLFTLLGIDETHRANANSFSKVVNNLNCRYKFGLSGTPERKDGRDFIVAHIIGPTIAKPKVESCIPRVVVVKTGVDTGYKYRIWTYMLRFLERQTKRNALIVKHAVNDLKRGHSIVIPVTFQSHVNTLVSMINKAVGKRVAVPFTGRMSKAERRKVILDARNGKVKVVVGMRQLIQLGINVPRWSAIYEVMPISNKPNHIQEVSRVLTPMEGKPKPLVKYFLDDMSPVKSCFRVCLFQTHTPLKHEISEETWVTIRKYLDMKDPGDKYKPRSKPKIKAF